jgi:hypothetical protein
MSTHKIETAKNLRLTADTHRTKGEYESALKLYLQALQIFEEISSIAIGKMIKSASIGFTAFSNISVLLNKFTDAYPRRCCSVN